MKVLILVLLVAVIATCTAKNDRKQNLRARLQENPDLLKNAMNKINKAHEAGWTPWKEAREEGWTPWKEARAEGWTPWNKARGEGWTPWKEGRAEGWTPWKEGRAEGWTPWQDKKN